MESLLSFGLTLIFLAESFYEVRLYLFLQFVAQHHPQAASRRRLQRILRLERIWNWVSWVFILALIILPNHYSILLVSIITMTETIIVRQMAQLKRKLNL
ncbi:MAG TPA: hypothetical protein H9720_03290 [Candidatus Limosilactobacillus intestinigallinarum]|nr:hypothetical protein [Candidatus Limosilactobacillus intestinigallinarum]